ncbi:D-alanyl-D-alanine carboxypeptidase [Streptomyces sp. di188]|nr:D-alanyl-D-alanine carboxypeptidase [Streptomyces sp. di188]SCD57036.1 D-alanyl-D-alanine carboxypeptidase [Streptomyces sp. di50b]
MAGESPDRSKQRESSAEQTSGSAGPVPEKQDPRLAVAREAGGSASGRKADTATRVLSVREVSASSAEDADADAGGSDAGAGSSDAGAGAEGRDEGAEDAEGAQTGDGRLREAVAAWVRSAEPKPEDASPDASGEDARPSGDADAEDASSDEASTAEASTAEASTAEASTAEDDEQGDASEGDASEGDASEGDAPKGKAPEGATAEATPSKHPASEDADAEDADVEDADADAEDADAEDADAESEAGEGEGAADGAEAPKAAAGAAAAPKSDRDAGTDEADAAGGRAGAHDGEADAEGTGKADDGGAHGGEGKAGAATTQRHDADADSAKRDDSGADETGDDRTTRKTAAGPAAAAAVKTEADADAEADAEAGTQADADADKADAQDGDGKGDAQDGDGMADGGKGTTKDGDADTGGGESRGTGAKGTGKAAGADAPVDQPTAAFRAPRPSAPAVDQPTTMLKLGDAAARTDARAAEAGRAGKFVALKPDPAIGQTPRQGGPAPAESTTFLPQVGPERTTQQPLPPKPPLDLLAELTNTPPPPQTPLRTAVRRIKIWTPLVLLLVIVFAVVQNFRPLPTPTLVLTAQDSYTFKGGKPQIPWPENGQAALDVEGIGTFGSSGEQKPVPIASVAKVMTAYVILRDHPLKSGADGPEIEIDKAAEEQSDAGQESTVDVTEGDAISEREAVEAILIASANNVARLLARWDAGSEEAFVEKMNEAAEDLGMSDTTYTDPSGLNDTTVSTAVDQVKLARAAMRQPAFREVAAMMEYIDYKGVKHGNWNRLVGRDDVVGIKTGTTTSALGNLSFAAKKDVDGEVHRIVGAVLRQPEGGEDNTILSGALDAGHKLILAGQDALRAETILRTGTVVGYADDGLGGRTPVVVTEDVKAVGWAGLEVKLTFAGTELPHTAEAGTEVGTLTVGDGRNGAVKVPVSLKEDLVEPGFTDKLTRVA